MAEPYNPNKRKRKETNYFGLEGHKELQEYKKDRDKLKKPVQKKVSGFDLPGAQVQIPSTIPTPESVKLDNIPRGGHPGAQHVVGSAFDYTFGPKFSTDPGKGRLLPTPPLAKRPWDKITRSKVLKDALRDASLRKKHYSPGKHIGPWLPGIPYN